MRNVALLSCAFAFLFTFSGFPFLTAAVAPLRSFINTTSGSRSKQVAQVQVQVAGRST